MEKSYYIEVKCVLKTGFYVNEINKNFAIKKAKIVVENLSGTNKEDFFGESKYKYKGRKTKNEEIQS